MDSRRPDYEISEENARQSLIRISQSDPINGVTSNLLPNGLSQPNGVDTGNGHETDDYRSKLIAISYTQSPDVITPSQFKSITAEDLS